MKQNKIITPLAVVIASIIATGCSTTGNDQNMQAQMQERQAMLDAKEQSLVEKEQSLVAKEQSLASQAQAERKVQAVPENSGILAADLLPPDAQKGECYARVWEPAQYKTITEKVLVKEEDEKIQTTPAQYKWVTKTVEISPRSTKLISKPAVYGTEKVTTKISHEQMRWRMTLAKNSKLVSDEVVEFAKKHSTDDIAGATPGMCFHEHRKAPTYKTVEEKVLVSEAYDTIDTTSPEFKTVEKTIVVSEASEKIVKVPATYKTVEEKVLVKPKSTVWKKGTGPIQRIDSATGEIMCLVEVPAEYKIVKKRVIDTPATTKVVKIPEVTKTIKVREQVADAREVRKTMPAKYKTITKRVLENEGDLVWHEIHNMTMSSKSRTGRQMCLVKEPAQYKTTTKRIVKVPASTQEMVIPAVNKTVKVKTLVSKPTEMRTKIPAVYKEVTRQELVEEGQMEWRSILCETNMTQTRITDIQRALKAKGYNPGPIDGVVGSQTISAMNDFQKANNLPVDKYLNVESIRALGISEK